MATDYLATLDAAAEACAARLSTVGDWTDRSRAWHDFVDAATNLDHAAIAAEIRRPQTALEFYADHANYSTGKPMTSDEVAHSRKFATRMDNDCGRTARTALEARP